MVRGCPLRVRQGIRCPASPPTSPPTGTPGYTDTIYNGDGQVTSTTNPIGGTTQYAYDGAGNKYCTVTPYNYANSTRCPDIVAADHPDAGSDSYLGATIDTFDADNRVIQETNPLGGHHPQRPTTTQDNLGNKLVESNNTTADPNVVTTYSYDADNRVISTTVAPNSAVSADHPHHLRPQRQCLLLGLCRRLTRPVRRAYQCPPWQAAWIYRAALSATLYSSTPNSSQANNVTTTFDDADGHQRPVHHRGSRHVDQRLRPERQPVLHRDCGQHECVVDRTSVKHVSLPLSVLTADFALQRERPATRPPSTTPPDGQHRSATRTGTRPAPSTTRTATRRP